MSSADRLFLEESCTILNQKLKEKLLGDPNAQIGDQDFQDFELSYSVASEGTLLRLKVNYAYLQEVLPNGSQALLERVWEGLPLQLRVDPDILHITVDAAALPDEATRQHCVQQLSTVRTWLLIGPLVERIRTLRDETSTEKRAAARAAGTVAGLAAAQPLELRVRPHETCWIIAKPDRILIIFTIHLDDEVDVALGRVFCTELAETNRNPTNFSLPCTFNEPKDVPSDLRGMRLTDAPNVGFLTLTLSDQLVRDASEERLHALARPVMTFRTFFHFHLKNAKSYLHFRLRKRLDGWQQMLNRARRKPKGQEAQRRLVSGKVFNPAPRAADVRLDK
eukprot:gnl/TRDRNA2_/TRDRNA2_186316_c0_seq1.p1 gnl/TRDRNA2_/TRDRNA2_186316_c0~~gnl/TRDRNA2_/TRDRNA2_186316_c0_seq1.p1  ORF type:complete len:336 (+),score=62.32 gnl/TRDRNA2_/TRDRNA2_186316_c0_seq1:136-1143(+)